MCGITGIYFKDNRRSVNPEILAQSNNRLTHRGPDDAGQVIDGHVGLAMRRLSIIDVAGGHQPIANEDGSVHIVYNGELYNYESLRSALVQKGHRFRTSSDTESILHHYEETGEDCVAALNGMFAFAIWNSKKQELFIVRDRLGIKPLFYYEDDEKIVFASEIKAILAFPDIDRSLQTEALFDYLTLNYIPAPKTIYRKIHKLPPGCWLRIRNDSLKIQRYWDFHYTEDRSLSLPAATQRLQELLFDAVKIRLMSEVPLGAFLSGGIDSSTMAYLITENHLKEELHTFSVGFETDSVYNELPFSDIVAGQLHTIHHTQVVKPGMVALLPKIVDLLDEPMSDPSIVPTYLLSEFTRKFVTVALSGDGGDELFAGYERQRIIHLLKRFYHLPQWMQRFLVENIFSRFEFVEQKDSLFSSFKRICVDISRGYASTFKRWITNLNETLLAEILSPDLYRQYVNYNAHRIVDDCFLYTDNAINQSLRFETKYYLPDDLLVKVDRMSMGHSLEVRVPFLDYRLVEFAASLPTSYKIRGRTTKYILKQAMKGQLPPQIISKPKQGFSPPIKEWLKSELKTFCYDTLRTDALSAYFKPEAIENLLASHYGDRRDFQYQIWTLLVFSIWLANQE